MMPDHRRVDGSRSSAAAIRALADIPVIMATIVDEYRRGMSLGAVGYLTKPIDRERLTELVCGVQGADGADAGPCRRRRSAMQRRAPALVARATALAGQLKPETAWRRLNV